MKIGANPIVLTEEMLIDVLKRFIAAGHLYDPENLPEDKNFIECVNCLANLINWVQLDEYRCPPKPKNANPFTLTPTQNGRRRW